MEQSRDCVCACAYMTVHISGSHIAWLYFIFNTKNMNYIIVTEPNGKVITDISGNILVQQKPGKCSFICMSRKDTFMV